ncbi:3-alpha domain-containing protein [Novipirellula aureliae]|uniref:3-alpha domain-containing protein n=1 Tax=Novipirellula aureliae TaxID=2527966 RepID=UPI0011B4C1DB
MHKRTLMHHHKHNREAAARLTEVPELSPTWQATLSKRADTGEQPNQAKRLG